MNTSASPALSGRGERREEIRDQLLAIVESLLESGESYTSISVERLTTEAEMPRTRFYAYFEDKADLLHAWALQLGEEAHAIFEDWWRHEQPIPRAELSAVLRRYVTFCQRHHTLLTAIQDAASVEPRLRALVDRMVGEHISALRSFIERGRREGWISIEGDPLGHASWLAWLGERGVLQLVGSTPPRDLRFVVESYTAIVWKSLYEAAVAAP